MVAVPQIDARIGGIPKTFLAPRGATLMFIPDEIRKCVCFLGAKPKPDREMKLQGTAFFVGVDLDDAGNSAVYAVTSRHCIDKIGEEGGEPYLRVNLFDAGTREIKVPFKNWHFHSSDEVDVAVAPIQLPDDVEYLIFSCGAFLTDEVAEEWQIGIGDEVFAIGLFTEHSGRKRNVPIARSGHIAAAPEEPVLTPEGLMNGYLIETRSVGGLSGSPVFVNVDPQLAIPAGTALASSGRRNAAHFLLGLVHGHWDYVGGMPRKYVSAGIAVAVPASSIIEVFNLPVFIEQRRSLIASIHAKRPRTTPD